MFVLKERHYAAIAEGLVAAGAAAGWPAEELNIWAYARVDTIEPAKLALLRSAGFRWLAIGVESGSAHVRDGAKKAMREADIMGVVSEVQAAGINVIANYIFGLPDDDLDTMQETLDLALELNTEFANFYSAMAYPGSPLYDRGGPDRVGRCRIRGAATASTTTTAGRSTPSTSRPPRCCASATRPSPPTSRRRTICA
jgi:anaerobic magnesium-protoporphyrin IX monomethyl ester cyclase